MQYGTLNKYTPHVSVISGTLNNYAPHVSVISGTLNNYAPHVSVISGTLNNYAPHVSVISGTLNNYASHVSVISETLNNYASRVSVIYVTLNNYCSSVKENNAAYIITLCYLGLILTFFAQKRYNLFIYIVVPDHITYDSVVECVNNYSPHVSVIPLTLNYTGKHKAFI